MVPSCWLNDHIYHCNAAELVFPSPYVVAQHYRTTASPPPHFLLSAGPSHLMLLQERAQTNYTVREGESSFTQLLLLSSFFNYSTLLLVITVSSLLYQTPSVFVYRKTILYTTIASIYRFGHTLNISYFSWLEGGILFSSNSYGSKYLSCVSEMPLCQAL